MSEATTRRERFPASAARPAMISSAQWLRFVAALLVVGYHMDVQLFRLFGPEFRPMHFGASGVDLFFVISGFIMVYTTEPTPPSFAAFMKRRIIRIVPLYWLITTLTLALALAAPRLFHSTVPDVAHIVSSYLMVPHAHPVTGELRPLLVPGWTLNAEMFFYLLFGLLLGVTLAQRVAAICIVLGALSVMAATSGHKGTWLSFYGAPLMLEFAAGCGVGWLFLKRPTPTRGVLVSLTLAACLVAACGVGLDVGEQPMRVLFWGVPAALAVYVCLSIERCGGWPDTAILRLGGDASYSLYLSHLFALGAIGALLARTGMAPALGVAGTRVVMIAGAIGLGIACYRYVEQPMLHYLTRRFTLARVRGVPEAQTSTR